jgi:ubiquitin C-terminal hydrolase
MARKRTKKANRSNNKIRGLKNLGNTCFLNSILQCLAQTPIFVELLRENLVLNENQFIRVLHDTLEGLQSVSGLNFFIGESMEIDLFNDDLDLASRPSKLLTELKKKYPLFTDGDQHDSHELLLHLLDILRSECSANDQDNLNNNVSSPEQIFVGYLTTTSVCQECLLVSSHLDDFLDLSLPIDSGKPLKPRKISLNVSILQNTSQRRSFSNKRPQRRAKRKAKAAITNFFEYQELGDLSTTSGDFSFYEMDRVDETPTCSLASCLKLFFSRELMSDNNKVLCDDCTLANNGEEVYTSITKQSTIASPPAVLLLHLKRFQSWGKRVRKINQLVSYPLLLDIEPYCGSMVGSLPHVQEDQRKILYSLYAVVQHIGAINGLFFKFFVNTALKQIMLTSINNHCFDVFFRKFQPTRK